MTAPNWEWTKVQISDLSVNQFPDRDRLPSTMQSQSGMVTWEAQAYFHLKQEQVFLSCLVAFLMIALKEQHLKCLVRPSQVTSKEQIDQDPLCLKRMASLISKTHKLLLRWITDLLIWTPTLVRLNHFSKEDRNNLTPKSLALKILPVP